MSKQPSEEEKGGIDPDALRTIMMPYIDTMPIPIICAVHEAATSCAKFEGKNLDRMVEKSLRRYIRRVLRRQVEKELRAQLDLFTEHSLEAAASLPTREPQSRLPKFESLRRKKRRDTYSDPANSLEPYFQPISTVTTGNETPDRVDEVIGQIREQKDRSGG